MEEAFSKDSALKKSFLKEALSLTELRELLQKTQPTREWLKCSGVDRGLPKGAITEISGCGKTELVVRLLGENPGLRAAWVEQKFSIFPFAFLQRAVDLERILFVEGGVETEWSLLQILKSQAFPVVVAYLEKTDVRTLRRWQLTAEKSGAALVWLTQKPQSLWPVSLQIRVERSEADLHVQVLKRKA